MFEVEWAWLHWLVIDLISAWFNPTSYAYGSYSAKQWPFFLFPFYLYVIVSNEWFAFTRPKIEKGHIQRYYYCLFPLYPPDGSYPTNDSCVALQKFTRIVPNEIFSLVPVMPVRQMGRIQKLKRFQSCDSSSRHHTEPAVAQPPSRKPGKLREVRMDWMVFCNRHIYLRYFDCWCFDFSMLRYLYL